MIPLGTVTLLFPQQIHYKSEIKQTIQKFPLTPMGGLAPGSAHARPDAQPPKDKSKKFTAHVSAESLFLNFPIFQSK
jgi:hypothetical protein